MSIALEKSGTLLKEGNVLLDALKHPNCTICLSRKDLVFRLYWLDDTTKTLEAHACNFDLDKAEKVLAGWTDCTRTALKALLEKCPSCASLPAGAKELIAEYRKNFKPVVEQENPGQNPKSVLA